MADAADVGDSGRPLPEEDVAWMAGQIGDLTKCSLPLPSGLRALGEEVGSRRLRRVLFGLARALESGMTLDAAVASQGRRLPAHLRGLVLAGMQSGRIGEVLGRFAGYTNVGTDLRRTLGLKLLYPIFTVLFAIGIFIFVCVAVMSGFARIFKDFGIPLPTLTRFVIGIAAGVSRMWWPFLQGLLTLAVLGLIASVVLRREARRTLYSAFPLVGPVWHLTGLAEFCHLLALLLESEVPLVEALTLAGEGVEDGSILAASREAAREVAQGRPLSAAVSRRSLFPEGFARILGWAEKNRGLPEALHMAGEMFVARARAQASFLSTLCSVLAVLSILGGVAVVVLALMIPLITLISRLAG